MDALDRLDPRRFDAEEACRKLNEFDELPQAERETYLGSWDYAGVEDCGHPFGALLTESHNACHVIRDLDGALKLLWEDLRSGTWSLGDLSAAHIQPESDLAEFIEHEELGIDAEQARDALRALASADSP